MRAILFLLALLVPMSANAKCVITQDRFGRFSTECEVPGYETYYGKTDRQDSLQREQQDYDYQLRQERRMMRQQGFTCRQDPITLQNVCY